MIRVSDGSDVTEEASGGGSPVNKFIHQLGQKYCLECKNLFEDLSKIIQKVMATRLELISFDKSKSAGGETEPGATPQLERKLSGVGVGGLRIGSCGATCYGCATACVEHCITLLRALATRQVTRPELHQQELVTERAGSDLPADQEEHQSLGETQHAALQLALRGSDQRRPHPGAHQARHKPPVRPGQTEGRLLGDQAENRH